MRSLTPPTSARGAFALVLLILALTGTGAGARWTAPASAAGPSARAWIAVEPDLGRVVSSHAADVPLPMASTTKLMTALLTLEHEPLGHRLTVVSYPRTDVESTAGLQAGERLTVADLLRAMLLPSANEAAQTLAVRVGGSEAAFVAMMNARAAALGLRATHYATPVGLDVPGNHSSAADLVRLAGYLMTHFSFFARTVAEPTVLLHSGAFPRQLVNRNDLVGRYPFVDGVKTGHTSQAGYVLVGAAHRNGVRILTAVLGDPSLATRDADTLALMRDALSRFRAEQVAAAGQALASVPLRYRSARAALVTRQALRVVVPVGSRPQMVLSGLPTSLDGPLAAGAPEGRITVSLGGRVLARGTLVTAAAVAHASLSQRLGSYLGRAVTIVLLIVLVACSLVLAGLRRRATRRSVPYSPRQSSPPG